MKRYRRLLTALDGQPRSRAIVEELYGTGARDEELVQLRWRQLVPDLEGTGGYATLYGKHGGRTIRVGRRTWVALEVSRREERPRRARHSRKPRQLGSRFTR